jgi:hypothetical protein
MSPTVMQRPRWDPGFDLDASVAAKRAVAVRAGGPAAAAGLRDSVTIIGVSVNRGNPAREIALRVVAGTDTTLVHYLPGSPQAVQQWSVTDGRHP